MGCAKSSLMICYLVFFDEQAVLFTFVVLSPPLIKVKTRNKAVLMCGKRAHQGNSNDTPQPIGECQVSVPLLKIRINQNKPG